MEPGSFDALIRHFSRAAWQRAGRMAGSETVAAGKNIRGKRATKGDVNKRCQQQAGEWVDFITFLCGDEPQPQCDVLIACADPLETCDFSDFLSCVTGSLQG